MTYIHLREYDAEPTCPQCGEPWPDCVCPAPEHADHELAQAEPESQEDQS